MLRKVAASFQIMVICETRILVRVVLTALITVGIPLYSIEELEEEDSLGKTYALFEGMDLQAKTEGVLYPIVGFNKKHILITRNGTKDPVSTKSEISYALRRKLSAKWVDLKLAGTEPFNNGLRVKLAAYNEALSQLERDKNRNAEHTIGRFEIDRVDIGNGEPRQSSSVRTSGSETHSYRQVDDYKRLINELEDKLRDPTVYSDSLEIVVELQSKELLKGCYLVLVARIDSPGTELDARPLIQVVGQLKPDKVRKVRGVFRNLPQALSLLGIDMHLYSQGEEIPHNGSAELKMISEEEAFKYSLGRYKDSKGHSEPALFRSLPLDSITSLL